MKYIKLLLIVVLILSLFASSSTRMSEQTSEPFLETDKPINNQTVSASDITVTPSSDPTPKATFPDDKYGGVDISYILNVDWNYTANEYIDGIPELDLEGIDALPVYKNLYPTGQEGYKFDISEYMLSGLKNKLITFLHFADLHIYDNQIIKEDEGTKQLAAL